jgi:hypothetical protein
MEAMGRDPVLPALEEKPNLAAILEKLAALYTA